MNCSEVGGVCHVGGGEGGGGGKIEREADRAILT